MNGGWMNESDVEDLMVEWMEINWWMRENIPAFIHLSYPLPNSMMDDSTVTNYNLPFQEIFKCQSGRKATLTYPYSFHDTSVFQLCHNVVIWEVVRLLNSVWLQTAASVLVGTCADKSQSMNRFFQQTLTKNDRYTGHGQQIEKQKTHRKYQGIWIELVH